MASVYTYERWEHQRCVDRIAGLSKDAAIEIARANSIVGLCTVSTPHGRGTCGDKMVSVMQFRNGRLVNEFVAGAETD